MASSHTLGKSSQSGDPRLDEAAARPHESGPMSASPADSSDRPRRYPGYGVAVVSTVALALTAPGQTFLVSLLNLPLREEYGMDALTLNGAYTVATVSASLPLVWVGSLTDRLGPRRMLIVVALAFGAGCVFMASAAHVAMVFVGFFLLRFLGQGSLALVGTHALAMWFHARLGRIEGLRTVALFAAWAVLPAATQAAIESVGWRATWAGFGVIIAVGLSLLAARFVKDRPEDLGLALDGATHPPVEERGLTLVEARRTRPYWALVVVSAISPMVGTAVLFDIQPLLATGGMDAGTAALTVGAYNATMALLAIPVGHLVDRVRPAPLLAAGTLAVGAASTLLLFPDSVLLAVAAMAVLAMGQSLISPTAGAATARFFGRAHHGAIRSSLARVGILAAGLGPLAFGASQRWAAGYGPALVGFVVLCVPAAAVALWVTPPRCPEAPLREASRSAGELR